MSIASMTNIAVARRTDFPPVNRVPRTMAEIADAARGTATAQNPVTAALAVIVTYIPTEVLTLYVAVLAAIQTPGAPRSGVWATFWSFLVLTPVIVWLVYAAKVRSEDKPLPVRPSQWPLWEMGAATVAYVAWAFSLPHAPFLTSIGAPATLAAVIVLVTAAMLGLLAPVFQRQIKAPTTTVEEARDETAASRGGELGTEPQLG